MGITVFYGGKSVKNYSFSTKKYSIDVNQEISTFTKGVLFYEGKSGSGICLFWSIADIL